jgi:ABC-type Fe3+ transport system permease subunit
MLWALRRWLRRETRPPRTRRSGRTGRSGRTRRRSRPVGCMIWVIAIIIVLLVLSILFGGFHQGSRASGPAGRTSVSLTLAAGRLGG